MISRVSGRLQFGPHELFEPLRISDWNRTPFKCGGDVIRERGLRLERSSYLLIGPVSLYKVKCHEPMIPFTTS